MFSHEDFFDHRPTRLRGACTSARDCSQPTRGDRDHGVDDDEETAAIALCAINDPDSDEYSALVDKFIAMGIDFHVLSDTIYNLIDVWYRYDDDDQRASNAVVYSALIDTLADMLDEERGGPTA